MNKVSEFIKYKVKAKGRHGVHSPFVYDLVDKCFKVTLDESVLKDRKSFYDSISTDDRKIQIEDHGVGSHCLGRQRKIKDIFKTSSSRGKYGDLLYKLSKFYQPQRILELGTSIGVGTFHLSKGNPSAEVITVEGCSETAKIARGNMQKMDLKNVKLIQSTFDKFISTIPVETRFDLVFIDGHHDGTALLNYLEALQPFTTDDTLFVLDDIRWSDSMRSAFHEIVQSDEYHLTIDLFRIAIISRKPGQHKEHFVMKY
ncbi:MAG: methyltransferase domain-containing protein [Bacteroidetes bacterium]|nr:MAG: methyltransferase domain-containing protein [Bacteroidota bacterium]